MIWEVTNECPAPTSPTTDHSSRGRVSSSLSRSGTISQEITMRRYALMILQVIFIITSIVSLGVSIYVHYLVTGSII